jgi:hypothetical protein
MTFGVARAEIGSQTRQEFIHQIVALGKLTVNKGNSQETLSPQVDLVTQLTLRVQKQETLCASLHVGKGGSAHRRFAHLFAFGLLLIERVRFLARLELLVAEVLGVHAACHAKQTAR